MERAWRGVRGYNLDKIVERGGDCGLPVVGGGYNHINPLISPQKAEIKMTQVNKTLPSI